ncbi:uncharacterized protein LOC128274032 [Anopheles cruzii]|uniref:uncharacterized protein LOC128274032 n=1 Tax=Anopheles cruzii TaxID=68878 RepID=UPI0022EC9295|nr:uncharacterized protein LOC128274032 [Anopheles cruzii]
MSPEETASYSPDDLNPNNVTMPETPILYGPTPAVPIPVMYNPTNFSPINAGGSRGPASIVPLGFKLSDSHIFNSLKPGFSFGHSGLLPFNGPWNVPAISTMRSIVVSWRTPSKGFRKRTTTGTKRFRSVNRVDESNDLRSLRRRTSSTTGMTPTVVRRRLRRRRLRTTTTRRWRTVTRYRNLSGQSTTTTRTRRRLPLARPWLRKTGTPGSRIVPIVLDYDFFVI